MLFALALLFAAAGSDQPVAPLKYSVAPGIGIFPAAASNGDSTFVVWAAAQGLVATRLAQDGTVLDTPYLLVTPEFSVYPWDVAWVGGHYLVAWNDSRYGTFVRRYAPDATPLDAAPRLVSPLHFDFLLTDGTNAALVGRGPVSHFQRIDADGTPLGALKAIDIEFAIGAANADGAVFLSPGGKSVHVAWNGITGAPRQLDVNYATVIVAGGPRFLVLAHGQALILDSDGAPAGATFRLYEPPANIDVAVWTGSSWIAGWDSSHGASFRRIGAEDRPDGPQQEVTGSSIGAGRAVWNGARMVVLGFDPSALLFDFGGDPGVRDVVLARSAAEQRGGSIVATETRALVAWSERTGSRSHAVRAAFIDGGRLSPPFEIDSVDDEYLDTPVVATDGRDFLVLYVCNYSLPYARIVTSEQAISPRIYLPVPGPPLAAAWNGSAYVALFGGETVYAAGLSGARLSLPVVIARGVGYGVTSVATIACDDTECAAGVRMTDHPPGVGGLIPADIGAFGARIVLDGSAVLASVRLNKETSGPPVLAMRSNGASLVILNDADRRTLSAVRLDVPERRTPLVTRNTPLWPIAADRGGVYWSSTNPTAGHELHWSRVGAAPYPIFLQTEDLGWIPQPLAAASTAAFSFVTYTTGEDDPALFAPRTFLRTFAAVDPRGPAPLPPLPSPRRRAAGH
ncbi:MAG TPA: hypothetical protein VJZ76_14730 [Thermoanaerobaculia bacterium]|nr:hypothetical protein [Thermoanaerobaculia bacterium]